MSLLARLGDSAAQLARKVVPDPFVIAVGLALVAVLLAWGRSGSLAGASATFAKGMFDAGLLAFGFKMALILVTGHALAAAPPVERALRAIAAVPRTPGQAAVVVAVCAMVLGLLNWGLGLVGGAFAAREVGRAFRARGAALNYPLIGAAGYLGLLVWHGGLSGSAPLTVATAGSFGPALPISETVLGGMNLTITAVLVGVLALLFRGLAQGKAVSDLGRYPALAPDEGRSHAADATGFLARLETSLVVTLCLAAPIAIALAASLADKGAGAVDLDFVILAFWALGVVVHKSPLAYAQAFGEGARGAAGILLQFPIYFGVLAAARSSGVLADVATGLNDLAAALPVDPGITAPILTFISASFINLLVPSGGGQWVLQQPIILSAIDALAVGRAEMVMAFSYGDQVTNMLQPFWALPLLSITGLKARDVMGYTIVAMLVAAPVFVLGLTLF